MTASSDYPLLQQINSPANLRAMDEPALELLADELREYLIAIISEVGGHLAAGLGTVELAVALHYVFHTLMRQTAAFFVLALTFSTFAFSTFAFAIVSLPYQILWTLALPTRDILPCPALVVKYRPP